MAKKRADIQLVERGLAESRERAQALIMAGSVFSGEERIDKPGRTLAIDSPLEVRQRDHPWASRGGVKLAHAIEHFAITLKDRIALDIGASTGGFTDVLLTHGARRVYAVDVGRGQLDWRLRQDPRVIVLEQTNARHLSQAEVPEPVQVITCDVSFIGLETVLPATMARAGGGPVDLIALIKPQFEVGKGNVGKGGVVRDPLLHAAVCDRIETWLARQPGWSVRGVVESPITGPSGNKEFLIAAYRAGEAMAD